MPTSITTRRPFRQRSPRSVTPRRALRRTPPARRPASQSASSVSDRLRIMRASEPVRATKRLMAALAVMVVAALASLVVAPTVPARAAGGEVSLIRSWTPFPADTATNGAVMVDPDSRVALAFSDSSGANQWARVQPISTGAGRPLGPLVAVPPFLNTPFGYSPHWVDRRHGLLVYATPATPGTGSELVGLHFSAHVGAPAFRVPLRFGPKVAVSLASDPSGRFLYVAATADRTAIGNSSVGSGSGVELDKISVDQLLRGRLVPAWTSTYVAPATRCSALVGSRFAPQMLAVGSALFVGCRQPVTPGLNAVTISGMLSGVVELDGIDSAAPSITTQLFPAPGNYSDSGETIAD